jgi:hypothetical protein
MRNRIQDFVFLYVKMDILERIVLEHVRQFAKPVMRIQRQNIV